MEQYKNFIDSLREVSFEVIGFMIPGFIYLVLILTTINNELLTNFTIVALPQTIYSWVFLILSYILGYVALGLSLICSNIFGKCSYQNINEKQLQVPKLFKACLNKYNTENPESPLTEEDGIRELRTRVMSFIPESDNKIYSFKFRSDLCENISKVLFLHSLISLLLSSIQRLGCINVIVNDTNGFICFYIILIIIAYILTVVRDRFYDIGMRVPLSIFLSKKNK